MYPSMYIVYVQAIILANYFLWYLPSGMESIDFQLHHLWYLVSLIIWNHAMLQLSTIDLIFFIKKGHIGCLDINRTLTSLLGIILTLPMKTSSTTQLHIVSDTKYHKQCSATKLNLVAPTNR